MKKTALSDALYKIGDVVKLVDKQVSNPFGWNVKMNDYLSKEMIVESVNIFHGLIYYTFEDCERSDGVPYKWSENCIAGFADNDFDICDDEQFLSFLQERTQ